VIFILFADKDCVCFIPGYRRLKSCCNMVKDCCHDGGKSKFEVLVESIGEAIWPGSRVGVFLIDGCQDMGCVDRECEHVGVFLW